MPTKTFSKELLVGLIWGDYDPDKYEVVLNDLYGHSRWSLLFKMVFKDKSSDRHYITRYSQGATECQDERPYDDSPDEIECVEVMQVETVVTQYEPN